MSKISAVYILDVTKYHDAVFDMEFKSKNLSEYLHIPSCIQETMRDTSSHLSLPFKYENRGFMF